MPFTLIDAIQRSKESVTFEVPTPEEIALIKVDGFVKIAAEFDPIMTGGMSPELQSLVERFGIDFVKTVNVERFWVKIISIENGIYEGKVNNDLAFTSSHGLKDDDMIKFEAKNIHSIL